MDRQPVAREDLTTSQKRSLERVIETARERRQDGSYYYELKKLELREGYRGHVFVTVVAGLPDDEGTLAQSLCRKRGHFLLGTHGKITAITRRYPKEQTAKERGCTLRQLDKRPLIWGWER